MQAEHWQSALAFQPFESPCGLLWSTASRDCAVWLYRTAPVLRAVVDENKPSPVEQGVTHSDQACSQGASEVSHECRAIDVASYYWRQRL